MKCVVDASLGNQLRTNQKVSMKKREKLLSLDVYLTYFRGLYNRAIPMFDLILAQLEVLRRTGSLTKKMY